MSAKSSTFVLARTAHVIDSLPMATVQSHLQSFEPDEKRRRQLRAILKKYRDLTTRELNRMLRRQFGTHISKGRIAYGDEFIDLQDYQIETLRANDRKAWQQEHPLKQTSSVCHYNTDTQPQQSEGTHLRKPTITKEGSRDQNREWEVGHNTRYDEIDDERQLKR